MTTNSEVTGEAESEAIATHAELRATGAASVAIAEFLGVGSGGLPE